MKVLHVDTSLEWRGGQQQLAYLLAGRPGDTWAGVPHSPLSHRVGPPALALHPGNDPRNAWLLRNPPCDLVAVHTSHAHGAALLCGRPVVVHRRVDFAVRHPTKYRRASAVIAVSRAVAEVLERAGIASEVVHDGVRIPPDGARFTAPGPVYGAAGAIVAHKGHRHLVEAMRAVEGTLLIAGEGSLPVHDRVRLLGHLPEIGGFLRSLDVFVHPSVEEGLGQVVIEALGAGCRVVATTAGGLPEAVGDAGILVPPRDPAALAAAMKQALARPKGEGIARAREFAVERMVERTGEVYRKALSAPR